MVMMGGCGDYGDNSLNFSSFFVSCSSFVGAVSVNVESPNGSAIVIPDFGQESTSTVLNTQTSKMNVCSPLAKEFGAERPRTKYTPLGEKGCNLLNANLLLSDSYINYLSDRSLDCTDACVCQPTDRKFAVRHLSMGKEPFGYTRGIDVCSCGLRTFEGEKLREHGGLFSADIRDVGSCMNDLGVAVDERYFDKGTTTTVDSCPVEKKTQVKKELSEDVKPCESADTRSSGNSAAVVEYLLDQFSSPLSAAATSERIALTEVGDKDEDSPLCRKSGGA